MEYASLVIFPFFTAFFALRSSKTIPTKSSTDGSPDIGRSLGGKPTGPTIPFYQRPTTTVCVTCFFIIIK